jgi:hypothetical protein
MTRWLANPEKGLRVDRASDEIVVSPIFDWFRPDWQALGGIRAAVLRYAPQPERSWLAADGADARLEYFDYDWTLNDWTVDDGTVDDGTVGSEPVER